MWLFALALCLSLVPAMAFAQTGLQPAETSSFDVKVQSSSAAQVSRVGGMSDLATMMEICEAGFAKDSCKAVVIIGAQGTERSVSAAGLAGVYDCPILLAAKDGVPLQTRFEIARVGASRAYVVADESAVSDVALQELRMMGLKVKRVAGKSVGRTANAVFAQGKKSRGWSKTAFVVSAGSLDDAVAASAYSYANRAPIFIASTKAKGGYSIPKATLKVLKKAKFTKVFCLGKASAVSNKAMKQVRSVLPKAEVKRLSGSNAVGISQRVADQSAKAGASAATVGFASRKNVRIGLMAGAVCGNLNAPLVVIAPSKTSSATKGFVKEHRDEIGDCLLFGSTKVVPGTFRTALHKATK